MKILCVPPGTLTIKEKEYLKNSHVFVIVAKEPDKVFFLTEANEKIKVNDISMAALKALADATGNYERGDFVKNFYKRLLEQENKTVAQ